MISSLKLASLCNVSQATVDRALHGRPGINPETRRRILEAAAAHGYSPNPAAREMMTGESRLVGALVPAINSVFFMDLMTALKEALKAQGLRLLLTPVSDRLEFLSLLDEFAARRMCAAIVVPPEENISVPSHITRAMRLVSLLNPCGNQDQNSLFLAPDEVATGRQAVALLVARGHRRIAHLTFQREALAIRERARGYELAMQELTGEIPFVLRDTAAPALTRLLETYQPTALFCHNDWLALTTIRTLGAIGRHVPQDLSVLGVDGSPTFQELCPGLTSLVYPAPALAQQAVEWIVHNRQPERLPPLALLDGCSIA